ncbi:4Fe-4S binding protein [Aureivirga marina]|uniref:4Fe-4S binding protein n=1 Tax=Aureivirga marina TaxID=1182451 RepID=UPI0018CA1EDB|nr:4Fe-4S dicluster domain-containing protein [Aureivirga marina]
MKIIKKLGLTLFIIGLVIFTSLIFIGKYELTESTFDSYVKSRGFKSELFIDDIQKNVVGKTYSNQFELSSDITSALENANETYKKEQQWDKVIWDKPHSLSYSLIKPSAKGIVVDNQGLFFFLTFGLGIIGALMFIIPDVVLLGPPGIKNNGIYQSKATNRGWIGYLAFIYLVSFYILLYFYADYIVNLVYLVDPISKSLSGNAASQWFLYGFLYCTVMVVMGIRMFIKYRHNKYQVIRTASVLFFQIAFAFLIPEILVRFNMPYFDFKNAWPLDYDFFFDWNIKSLINSGTLGIFMLVWGTIFSIIIIPIVVYFYGKRWYCSWVCGCGGLAETLGDPYRQLSDKSMKAWKIERYLIHSVLVFAIIMTAMTLYTYFTGVDSLFGIKTYDLQFYYGFLIGSIFSGVIGTGFYPVMGNRVWCRFGCPLAAYMGIVQRFKSRFRITTNGGQCISCGNCSTYCEQGIDVRAYAQKGQNIVRASCVGCGVCSAVCPRGVLKLENGPEEGRIQENPTLLGNDIDLMKMLKDK